MGSEVPATRTPVTKEQAATFVVNGLRARLGREPSEQEAVYTMALAWVESGRGQSIYGNNPGNVSCYDNGKGWSGDFWRPPWFPEQHDPKYDYLHQRMLEGKAPRAFRAYPDQQTGWNDYLREVVRRIALLAAMNADDPAEFVRQLVETKYSIDYNESHVKTYRSIIAEIRSWGLFSSLPKASPPPAKKPSVSGLGLALGAGGAAVLLMVLLAAKKKRR
jgi:hypothetical protein